MKGTIKALVRGHEPPSFEALAVAKAEAYRLLNKHVASLALANKNITVKHGKPYICAERGGVKYACIDYTAKVVE